MRFLASNLQALFALSLVLGTQALPRLTPAARPRESGFQPIRRGLYDHEYNPTSNCEPQYNDYEARRRWHDSQAGVLGDDFIHDYGVEGWVERLDKEVFQEPTSSWNCFDPGNRCELNRQCYEYADRGLEGAYYLAKSIQKIHGTLRSWRTYLTEGTVDNILQVPRIMEDFEKPESDAKPNVLILIASAFGMLAGGTAPVAPVAGLSAVASGLFVMTGNLNPPEVPEQSDPEDFEVRLTDTLKAAFNMVGDKLDDISGAIVGDPDKDQSMIPSEMIQQSFDNPIIGALGNGRWLVDDPARGVEEAMQTTFTEITQALVWMVIRYGRKGFWFIDAGVDKEKCGDGDDDKPGEFWHDQADGCVKLMEIKSRVPNESVDFAYFNQDIHDKLWGNGGRYDLDIKITFQNSHDCWVGNDGKVGEIEFDSLLDPGLPKCWFGIPVVRGEQIENGHTDTEYMSLHDFPGHYKGILRHWYGDVKDGKLIIE